PYLLRDEESMRSSPSAQSQFRIFDIKGWHEDASAQVAVMSSADITTARRIISSQSSILAERCKALEQNLREVGIVDKALEASKVRPQFNLTLTPSAAPRPQKWRSSSSENIARRKWEPAPPDRQITDWLFASAPPGSTLAVCGLRPHEPIAKQLKARGY